jgi:hemolysin III
VSPGLQAARVVGSAGPPDTLTFVKPRLRGVLHQAFFPLFLAAGVVLVAIAGTTRGRVAMSSYWIGLAACIGVSALYHRGRWTPRVRDLLGRVDHSLIFALIAGTYTPICLLVLSGPLAWTVLGVVWIGGILGALLAVLWPTAPAWIEVTPYTVVGWVAVVSLPQLLGGLGWGGLSLLLSGGLLYTGGAVIYGRQRPDPFPTVFGYHEIFHVLVVLAAAAQCVTMFVWVLPRTWS